MVKVTGPLFSVRARGSLGDGISFQGSGAGVRVERRPRHKDRQSNGQVAHRDLFLEAVAYWHGLAAEVKAEYNGRGDVLHLTGYNLCLREYLLGKVGAGGEVDLLPNYWNAQRLEPSTVLPSSYSDARPVAGIGAWGNWVSVEAAIAADLVLVALHYNVVTVQTGSCWMQLGYDPEGGTDYTVVEEVGEHAFISGTGAVPIHGGTRRLAPFLVLAGSRIGMRARKTAGHTGVGAFLSAVSPEAGWVDPWPNTYIEGARVTGQRRFPVVNGWQNSVVQPTWTEVYAAAPNDMLLTALEWDPANAAGAQGEVVEVGVGPVGEEVVAARVGIPSIRILSWASGLQEFGRKALILSGERVVVRHGLASGTRRVALYFEDLVAA